MKLGFVGIGVVGGATLALARADGYDSKQIKIYDPAKGHQDSMKGCDAVFISVPVPTNARGEQDLSILEEALGMVPEGASAFIRSTVLPGTCDRQAAYFTDIDIFSMPEFLTERQAEADAKRLPVICSDVGAHVLAMIFKEKILIPMQSEMHCEFVKYVHNSFCAMKVGFFNLIHQAVTREKLDYDQIVAAACAVTGFIEPTHTKVPGPDGQFGFGGKCLPKDLFAFAEWMKQEVGRDTFLTQILSDNFRNRFESLF